MEDKRPVKTVNETSHNLIMENRSRLSISGVDDVESFDEQMIILYTAMGTLTVKGGDFRINKLNVDSGEILIEGEIDSVTYSGSERRDKSGFFAKMFK